MTQCAEGETDRQMRKRRQALPHHDQMMEAATLCVQCKLCGGAAEITDAGPGWGYYINCSNAGLGGECTQGGLRLSGWAYNVSDMWNRLNSPDIAAMDREAALVARVAELEAARDMLGGFWSRALYENVALRANLATSRADQVVIATPRRLVPEVLQWVDDEIASWPEDTAYQRDLAESAAAPRAHADMATPDDDGMVVHPDGSTGLVTMEYAKDYHVRMAPGWAPYITPGIRDNGKTIWRCNMDNWTTGDTVGAESTISGAHAWLLAVEKAAKVRGE